MPKFLYGLLAFIVIGVLVTVGGYNGLNSKEQAVIAQMSEIQNQQARRHALLPKLIATVKGYVAHEQGVFEQVTQARANVGKFATIDASKIANDPALLKQFSEAQAQMASSLTRLLAVAENYPQLKADALFSDLLKQIEGIENRITVAQNGYIEAVRTYDTAVTSFPGNVFAGVFGFTKKPQLTFDAQATEDVTVDFKK